MCVPEFCVLVVLSPKSQVPLWPLVFAKPGQFDVRILGDFGPRTEVEFQLGAQKIVQQRKVALGTSARANPHFDLKIDQAAAGPATLRVTLRELDPNGQHLPKGRVYGPMFVELRPASDP